MDVQQFLEQGNKHHLPNLSIDIVIIGYAQHDLKCLMLEMEDKWLLPGGYIRNEESVNDAALRILKERTGLEDPHLKFLSVFGHQNRFFSEEWKAFFAKINLDWQSDYWINNRFVTLTYYSLVNIENTKPKVGNFDKSFAWMSFDKLPDIWLDHKEIVLEARNRLKEDIKQEHSTHNLLAEKFTMPELHRLHQNILEEELDRSRFQKKMLATGLFERLPKKQKESPGSNPYQYRVKSVD